MNSHQNPKNKVSPSRGPIFSNLSNGILFELGDRIEDRVIVA